MSASQQMSTLSDRAKKAEDHVKAADAKSKAELKTHADAARKSSEENAAKLKKKTSAAQGEASGKWNDMKTQWAGHVASVHQKRSERKAELDAKHAERRAEDAEADAENAVDFAYATIEEAESAVLDAQLARVEADNLAAAPS
jgi:vacuolar-type H+-ATPase subunit I/STV1